MPLRPMPTLALTLIAVLSSGCFFISDAEHDERRQGVIDANKPVDTGPDDTAPPDPVDADGDGWAEGEDCDDSAAAINPDADERCDEVDNDCDGDIDEDDAVDALVWWVDADGDGYGDASVEQSACEQRSGLVEPSGDADCDDGDAAIHPGADEYCNEVDDDCDGDIDETDAVDASSWYHDGDGDGYGDPDDERVACDAPSGCVSDNTDCDDAVASANPGADERCNDQDDDCDGTVDEDDAVDASVWWADTDGDGYGDSDTTTNACEQPSGYVIPSGSADCDDTDSGVHPGATEICDGVDEDCDGDVDEGATDVATWYRDDDGDGYGDASRDLEVCEQPSGYADNDTDCDDTDSSINPGVAETCNEVDDDCDGLVDDDDTSVTGTSTWYSDADGDGFGDASSSTDACDQPSGYGSDSTDCDDGDAAVNPDASETCNSIDDDCDGLVDDDDSSVTGTSTWYEDGDGDGFGDASSSTDACDQPSGYGSDDTDCDDGDAAVSPSASETCNGVDDDCDGLVDVDDPGVTDASTWYDDSDGDGYGDSASATFACSQPTGTVSDDSDCDDGDSSINPGATDLCSGVDEDCDGTADDSGAVTFYDSSGAATDMTSSFGGGSSTSAAGVTLSDDGTVLVCGGTYDVHLSIRASVLTIQGIEGASATILQGDGSDTVIDIDRSSATLRLDGLTVTGGYASEGGGLTGRGGSLEVSVSNGIFSGNDAVNGGAVHLEDAIFTMSDTRIESNSSSGDGGGLYLVDCEVELDGVSISSNVSGEDGGGLFTDGTAIELANSTVEANEAADYGAGMFVDNGDLTLTRTEVLSNLAGIGGAGVMIRDSNGSIDSSTVQANETSDWGAGLLLSNASVDLVSSLVIENVVTDTSLYDIGGGALVYDGSVLTCTGSASEDAGIYANRAGDGGGVYVYDSTSELHSYSCDWGESTEDNDPDDVDLSLYGGSYDGYGDDEDFSCSGGIAGSCL